MPAQRTYNQLSEMIAYLDKRIAAQEARIEDFKRRVLPLVEADDPSWLDWQSTRLDMESCLHWLKRTREEAIYQRHSAQG